MFFFSHNNFDMIFVLFYNASGLFIIYNKLRYLTEPVDRLIGFKVVKLESHFTEV